MRLGLFSNKFVVASAVGAALAVGCSAAPTEPTPALAVSAPALPGTPAIVTQAIAEGLSPAQLMARGWTCAVPPPRPIRTVCSPPHQGLPSPATPVAERDPVYTVLVFSQGNFLGTQIILREDLYHGQVCRSTGLPYIYRPAIGYYECLHTVGN